MAVATANTGGLSAQQAAAQAALQQKMQNRQFMALSLNKEVLCQQANGGALSQSWVAGQPLTYNVPSSNNGFLTGFWVQCSLTATLGAVQGANTYQQNAASPLSLIDSINVLYGGTQHNFRPYVLKYLSQMSHANGQVQPRSIVAGQLDTYLQAYYSSAPWSTLANSGNTFNFSFFVPMSLIHPQDVRGILPIQNGETSCQVVVNCQGAPYGPDPILNTFVVSGGTAGTATVTGTVKVIATYKDGSSYAQLTALQPNLSQIDTVQILRDANLNNLGSGQIYTNKVSFLHKIPWLFITVVDGQQSNQFAQTSNIAYIGTSGDQAGNKIFLQYGLNTNLDTRAFYDDLSGQFGGLMQQDFDEGFFPLVYGPIFQQADSGIMEGQAYLDMTTQSGWTDWHYRVQCNAVGAVSGINPRVECTAIILNDPLVA